MTASATLRAALEKDVERIAFLIRGDGHLRLSEVAAKEEIWKLMESWREEGLDNVAAWVENHSHPNIGMGVMTVSGLKHKLAALKTSPGGSLRESEG